MSLLIFQYNAIDEKNFKNLEKQVSIIQQKILTLHKIKEIEDTLDDQKSSMLKNKDDITSLNDGYFKLIYLIIFPIYFQL